MLSLITFFKKKGWSKNVFDSKYFLMHNQKKENNALIIKDKLIQITDNADQVATILLVAKGFGFEEITQLTSYKNALIARAAYLTGKKKIVAYFQHHPKESQAMKALILK